MIHMLINRAHQHLLPVILVAVLLITGGVALVLSHTNANQTVAGPGSLDVLAGQWQYLPGSAAGDQESLRIQPDNFSIVHQDGSGGQPNPPVNLFGTHLETSGSWHVFATLSDVQDSAALQLYGQVPLVADEFRVERKSIRLSFAGSTLTASRWNGTSQTPFTMSLPFSPAPDHTINLAIAKAGKTLSITINGRLAGIMPEDGSLSTGTVWLGADATKTAWTLSSLQASADAGGHVGLVDTSAMHVNGPDAQGLQTLASRKRPGFVVGAAMALAPAVSDSQYAGVAFGGNFGSLTTENALKWQFVHPTPDTYDFHEADALVALAQRHNMTVHGHTLVFGEANPAWAQALPTATASDKQHVQDVMTDHIKTVAGHYKGKMSSWDVVNEPLADSETFDPAAGQTFRNHIWYRAMGEGYIATAFTAARQTDPQAQLFMNEYGLEFDGERWDAFFALVSKLKAQGVPIDGVGFQSHVYEAGDKIDPAVLRAHIQKLARIGLKSRISEMDVYNDDGQAVQTQQFPAIFQACLAEPTCVSWTTWGVSDRYDFWQDDDGSIQQGADLLWDKRMRPTPAVDAIRQLLQ